MGLLEEALPHFGFYSLTPGSQFGSALKDFAASTDRLNKREGNLWEPWLPGMERRGI